MLSHIAPGRASAAGHVWPSVRAGAGDPTTAKCLAADIHIPGVSVQRIIASARSAPAIGGIGTCCSGIVHVDVGPKRHWNYCGGLARPKKRAKFAAR